MQVGHHGRRRDVEQVHEVCRRAVEGVEGFQGGHVADVLAHDGDVVVGQADRRLEFAADREHGGTA